MRLVTVRRSPAMKLRTEFGFTLIELMLVVAITLIVGGFAMVNAVSAARSLRLNEATTDYSNLLQKARISAVKDDTYYTVQTTTGSPGTPATAIVHVNTPPDPTIVFPGDVSPQASGPNLSNLEAQFLPANAQFTLNNTNGPTFGPRGLPCTPSAGVCPSLTPTSYITFLQDNESQKWAAVTVNPSARIRRWSYDGSSWNPVN